MKEALEAFVEWTFLHRTSDGSAATKEKPPEVKKTKLYAGVFAENVASMRTLEACGFRREGVQRGQVVTRYGVEMDLVLYGLGKGEWEEGRRGRGEEVREG